MTMISSSARNPRVFADGLDGAGDGFLFVVGGNENGNSEVGKIHARGQVGRAAQGRDVRGMMNPAKA